MDLARESGSRAVATTCLRTGLVGDGTLDSNRDGDYLGMPYLTSFCTACKRIRSDEPFLSHVARDPDLRARMCMKVSTTVSVRLCVAVGDSVRLRDALSCRERQLGSVLTSTCNTFWPSPF